MTLCCTLWCPRPLPAWWRASRVRGVVESRLIVFCPQRGVHWDKESELPECDEDGHDHQEFEVHRHLDAVLLPDGITVTAASFDPANPYLRERLPDYGLYLDPQWQPPWDHDNLEWPDFGVPDDARPVLKALRFLRDRAHSGQQVEIGCFGGHGRTGTALACLAVLGGTPSQDAVTWVKANYCSEAVETPEQAAFASSLNPQ
jgi:hypothetical protein